jgi:hypothetical protein
VKPPMIELDGVKYSLADYWVEVHRRADLRNRVATDITNAVALIEKDEEAAK